MDGVPAEWGYQGSRDFDRDGLLDREGRSGGRGEPEPRFARPWVGGRVGYLLGGSTRKRSTPIVQVTLDREGRSRGRREPERRCARPWVGERVGYLAGGPDWAKGLPIVAGSWGHSLRNDE